MEVLNISGVTLQGYAQGGWRTSIHVPEFDATFDAGTALPISCGRYFITHGHPDHAGAIPSIIARRSQQQAGDTEVFVPTAIARHLQTALGGMHRVFGGRRPLGERVMGVQPGDTVPLRPGVDVRVLRTYHGVPSVGYALVSNTKKLKPEFHGLSGPEIVKVKQQGVEITEQQRRVDLCIPGDTKIDFFLKTDEARKAKVLVHEVTVWDREISTVSKTRQHGHTHVDEMIEHCEKFEGEALVLCHRSMKHSRKEIEKILKTRFPAQMLPKIHIFDGGDRQKGR